MYLQVNDSCEVPADGDCLQACRDEFNNEADLPDACPLDCTKNRPILFVNNDAVAQAGGDSRSLATFLEGVANNQLGMYNMACSWILY